MFLRPLPEHFDDDVSVLWSNSLSWNCDNPVHVLSGLGGRYTCVLYQVTDSLVTAPPGGKGQGSEVNYQNL